MKKKLVLGVGAIVIIAALIGVGIIFSDGLFSVLSGVIGEEGYQPYDSMLASGTFDQGKWTYVGTSYGGSPFNCVGSASSCNGGSQICSAPLSPYQGISATPNSITVSSLGYGRNDGYQGPYLRTKDLRLKDFKAEWSIAVTRCSSNKWWHGGGRISTNRGDIYVFPEGSGSSPTGPVGIELLWDNYDLGHYQIKANGQIVQEGTVPEGEQLYIQIEPDTASCNSECSGTATLTNPRIKEIFSCDLQEGQVKASVTFDKPGLYSVSDLRGFKSFCPDLEQLNFKDGIGGNRNRVIYEIAAGKEVAVGPNEFWEIQYIADRKTLGVSDQICALWDVDVAKCTGKIDLCNEDQFLDGIGCVSLQEDLVDLQIDEPSITNNVIEWSSFGRVDGIAGVKRSATKTTLYSSASPFMETGELKIDEAACPYTDSWKKYPGGSGTQKSCYSFTAFGKTFKEGDEMSFGSGLKVKLANVGAQYRKDDDDGKLYRWVAKWQLTFDPSAATVDVSKVPTSLQLGEVSSPAFLVSNNLPSTATFLTTVRTKHTIISDFTDRSSEDSIMKNGAKTISVRMPTDILGKNDVVAWATLKTEVGNIAFKQSTDSYNVLNSEFEDLQNQSAADKAKIQQLIDENNILKASLQEKAQTIANLLNDNQLTRAQVNQLVEQLSISEQDKMSLLDMIEQLAHGQSDESWLSSLWRGIKDFFKGIFT